MRIGKLQQVMVLLSIILHGFSALPGKLRAYRQGVDPRFPVATENANLTKRAGTYHDSCYLQSVNGPDNGCFGNAGKEQSRQLCGRTPGC